MKQVKERGASKTSLWVLVFLITASLTVNVYLWHDTLQVNMAQISQLCGQTTAKALSDLKGEMIFEPEEFESLRTTKLLSAGWKPALEKTASESVIVKEGSISMAVLYVNGERVTKIASLRR